MTEKIIQDIIQWDVKSWSVALKYWEENTDWKDVDNALELGGNEGGLSLWLALKGKNVLCSDYKNTKATAQPLHERYNVLDLVSYEDIDATSIPYENHFDLIVFKSIIGGIGRDGKKEVQEKVFQQILKALKPGGKLLFAENLSASPLHKTLREKFVKWGSSWRYVTMDEMKHFLRDYSSFTMKSTGFLGLFGRNENQRNTLSTIDKALLNKISPENWKYICYGIAIK